MRGGAIEKEDSTNNNNNKQLSPSVKEILSQMFKSSFN